LRFQRRRRAWLLRVPAEKPAKPVRALSVWIRALGSGTRRAWLRGSDFRKNLMRYAIAILGLVLVLGTLAGLKASQIGKLIHFGAEMQKAGAPPEIVGSRVAEQQNWEATLSAVGSVVSAKGVALSNDSPGLVSQLHFESGGTVKQGQVLVELDTSVERAQLASTRARREFADVSQQRSRALSSAGVVAKSQVDSDESSFKSLAADASAIQAQIDRKVVRAPFSGRLGIRQVNLGQYLSPGTTIAVLESTDSVYVDFTLPQRDLAQVKEGMPVRIAEEGNAGHLADGKVVTIDPSVDPITRNVKVRAAVPNADQRLRPGMFVSVDVVLPQQSQVVAVPVTAIVHAAYGDSVFCVEPKKDDSGAPVKGANGKPVLIGRQQFVRVGPSLGDFVSILDGVKAGQELVTAGAFKLRNNSTVIIDNTVANDPKLSPHPENH